MVVSSGLGGGSLVYANVMLPKDEETFVREDLPRGGRERWPLRRGDLEPHYGHVRAMQAPQRFPADVEPYASTARPWPSRMRAEHWGSPQSAPSWRCCSPRPAVSRSRGLRCRASDLHGRPRSTCGLCGECDLGCNFGAKNTLDYTYLTRGPGGEAQLRTCCEVETIEPLDRGERATGSATGSTSGARGAPSRAARPGPASRSARCAAGRVILAAGAVGTPRLLLINRGALPGLSPATGKRVSANGDALAMIRDAERPPGPQPRPRDHGVDRGRRRRSASGRGFQIQDGGAPVLADWCGSRSSCRRCRGACAARSRVRSAARSFGGATPT